MNFIYATNTAAQTSASGDVIDFSAITRRYGDVTLTNSAIAVSDPGWYEVSGQITFTSTAGQANVSIYQDGQQVTGAVSGLTADANTAYTLNVQAVVRKGGCRCVPSAITMVNTGATALTISNANIKVARL